MTDVGLAESSDGAPNREPVDGSPVPLLPWHDRARRCGVGRVVGVERSDGVERGQLAGPRQALLAARGDDAASTGIGASDDAGESWQLRHPDER